MEKKGKSQRIFKCFFSSSYIIDCYFVTPLRGSAIEYGLNHGLKPVAIIVNSPPGFHDILKHLFAFPLRVEVIDIWKHFLFLKVPAMYAKSWAGFHDILKHLCVFALLHGKPLEKHKLAKVIHNFIYYECTKVYITNA